MLGSKHRVWSNGRPYSAFPEFTTERQIFLYSGSVGRVDRTHAAAAAQTGHLQRRGQAPNFGGVAKRISARYSRSLVLDRNVEGARLSWYAFHSANLACFRHPHTTPFKLRVSDRTRLQKLFISINTPFTRGFWAKIPVYESCAVGALLGDFGQLWAILGFSGLFLHKYTVLRGFFRFLSD